MEQDVPVLEILGIGARLEVFLERVATLDGGDGRFVGGEFGSLVSHGCEYRGSLLVVKGLMRYGMGFGGVLERLEGRWGNRVTCLGSGLRGLAAGTKLSLSRLWCL